jgi:hypothetical protein
MQKISLHDFGVILDLRWNQLGPGMGRTLLHAVQDSPQLCNVHLDGNLFNSDLTLAIGKF